MLADRSRPGGQPDRQYQCTARAAAQPKRCARRDLGNISDTVAPAAGSRRREPGTAATGTGQAQRRARPSWTTARQRLQEALNRLNQLRDERWAKSVASGPFFNAYIANLLPGQFMQPFIDAAFSDLGPGPEHAVAVGAHRSANRSARDAGAAGARTPHRAGRRTPTDHPRRHHRQSGRPRSPTGLPLPAPPPGGPPPGPPAPPPPGQASTTGAALRPRCIVPAPNEAPHCTAPGQPTEGAPQ